MDDLHLGYITKLKPKKKPLLHSGSLNTPLKFDSYLKMVGTCVGVYVFCVCVWKGEGGYKGEL
jgi:hypothetical protein